MSEHASVPDNVTFRNEAVALSPVESESFSTVGNSHVVELRCVGADTWDKLLPLCRHRCEGLLLVDYAGVLWMGKLVNVGALSNEILPFAVLV